MELDWYCTDMLKMRHQCWCGLLWIFKRLLVSLLGRQRSPHQNVWFLIFNIQANRVAIVSTIITKDIYPWQVLDSHNSTCFETTVPCIVIASFYCSTFALFSVYAIECLFVWFSSFVQCSNYSVYFLSWSWKCIPDILISFYNNQQAINKHHTTDSTIFSLSIGSERPITIIDIEGYPEPVSLYGLSGKRDM